MWTYKLFAAGSHLAAFTNPLISMMMLGAAVAVFIGFIANVFTKISLHAIGAGCFVGLTLSILRLADYDLRLLLLGAIILAGLIGTARMRLGAHTQRQIYYGYMAGFIGQFFSFSLMPLF
jgi:membrane-associated phospholipid phosphatase